MTYMTYVDVEQNGVLNYEQDRNFASGPSIKHISTHVQ